MGNSVSNPLQRLPWVDVSKGILILFVVLGHIEYYAQEFVGSHAYDFLHHIVFIYLPYYIPAFFVVTGYCSNFNLSFRDFLIKNIKTLLVPSILIGTFISRWISLFLYGEGLSVTNFMTVDYLQLCWTGGHWFLTTLFLAKIALYFPQKFYNKNSIIVFVVLLLLMLLGTILYNKNIFPNIWYFKHTMILLPFLYVGTVLRKNPQWTDRSYNIPLGVGILALAFLMPYIGLPYPYIVGVVGVYWGNFLLCVVMVVSGSLMIFSVSKKIQDCKYLELLGKHSLAIFLLHSVFLIFFLRLFKWMGLDEQNIGIRIGASVFLLFFSSLFPLLLDMWIDKHASFLKGKF